MNWVSCWRVPPPSNKTISVKSGGSVCFAAYSEVLRRWVMIPSEEKIDPPQFWYCSEEYAKEHQRDLSEKEPRREGLRLRKKRQVQLSLFPLNVDQK